MQRLRVLLIVVGVVLPYLARIPGALVHGADWFLAYVEPDLGGHLFLQAFNALAWGTVVTVSFLTSRRSVIWPTAGAAFGLVAFGHATLDLAGSSTAAVAVVFIPIYAVPFATAAAVLAALIGTLIRWRYEGRLTRR